MASDMEQGLKKTLSLSKQATELTSDIMKEMMKTFLSGNAEKKGKIWTIVNKVDRRREKNQKSSSN